MTVNTFHLRDHPNRRDNSIMDDPKRVELKISLDATDITAARERLGLTEAGATTADIWFCDQPHRDGDDVTFELFDRGVIVRLRHKHHTDSDTTVKYRRRAPFALPADWDDADRHPDLRIEGDWTGDSHQVSASLDSRVAGTIIDEAVRDGPPLTATLFSAGQRRFATALTAPHKVKLTSLQPFGPIHALRWQEMLRSDLDEKLGAEQWTADDHVFLELSIRVKFNEAKKWQHKFTDWASDKDLDVKAVQTTKTQAVLKHFAKRLQP